MTIQDAKRKVRSLLEVSKEDSGAMKAERETARSIAKRIMEAHGLKESDIPERTVEVERPIPPMPPSPKEVFVVNIGGGYGGFQWSFDGSDTTTST